MPEGAPFDATIGNGTPVPTVTAEDSTPGPGVGSRGPSRPSISTRRPDAFQIPSSGRGKGGGDDAEAPAEPSPPGARAKPALSPDDPPLRADGGGAEADVPVNVFVAAPSEFVLTVGECTWTCKCSPVPTTVADYAILPGYGARGPNYLSPPFLLVPHAAAGGAPGALVASPGVATQGLGAMSRFLTGRGAVPVVARVGAIGVPTLSPPMFDAAIGVRTGRSSVGLLSAGDATLDDDEFADGPRVLAIAGGPAPMSRARRKPGGSDPAMGPPSGGAGDATGPIERTASPRPRSAGTPRRSALPPVGPPLHPIGAAPIGARALEIPDGSVFSRLDLAPTGSLAAGSRVAVARVRDDARPFGASAGVARSGGLEVARAVAAVTAPSSVATTFALDPHRIGLDQTHGLSVRDSLEKQSDLTIKGGLRDPTQTTWGTGIESTSPTPRATATPPVASARAGGDAARVVAPAHGAAAIGGVTVTLPPGVASLAPKTTARARATAGVSATGSTRSGFPAGAFPAAPPALGDAPHLQGFSGGAFPRGATSGPSTAPPGQPSVGLDVGGLTPNGATLDGPDSVAAPPFTSRIAAAAMNATGGGVGGGGGGGGGSVTFAAALVNQGRSLLQQSFGATTRADVANRKADEAAVRAAIARALQDARAADQGPETDTGRDLLKGYSDLESALKKASDAERRRAAQEAANATALADAAAVVWADGEKESAKVLAHSPSQGQKRIDEEVARQSTESYRYQQGRGRITDDRAQDRSIAQLERAGDRAVDAASGSADGRVKAMAVQHAHESAAHDGRRAALTALDQRERELDAAGRPTPKQLRELQRLRADRPRRAAERVRMASRELKQLTKLRKSLLRLIARLSASGRHEQAERAAALAAALAELDKKIEKAEAALKEAMDAAAGVGSPPAPEPEDVDRIVEEAPPLDVALQIARILGRFVGPPPPVLVLAPTGNLSDSTLAYGIDPGDGDAQSYAATTQGFAPVADVVAVDAHKSRR